MTLSVPSSSKGADTIDALKKEYGDKIRVVFKNLPLSFHKNAELAARAAHAAGKQGKFWEMHDKLFDNFRTLGADPIKGFAQRAWAGHGEVGEGSQQPVHEGEGRGR